ncbi:MAG: mechanosensitive ion channel family protein, partial [Puniceicoccales bacterium]|nr:mechanosensitive ion channel family protein [Puniceicoccales bacterium]
MFLADAATEVTKTTITGSHLDWNSVLEWLQVYGIRVFWALVIFFAGRWLASIIAGLAGVALARTKITPTLNAFLVRVIHILLVIVVVVAALDMLGVPTTSLVAIIGAASLAIGLALQNSLSNFAAGIMIVLLRPFQINDYIEAGSVSGTVEEIGIFTTQLRTSDNRVIVAPNSSLTSQSIVNVSAKPTRR